MGFSCLGLGGFLVLFSWGGGGGGGFFERGCVVLLDGGSDFFCGKEAFGFQDLLHLTTFFGATSTE